LGVLARSVFSLTTNLTVALRLGDLTSSGNWTELVMLGSLEED
jgi:hypothetical protein